MILPFAIIWYCTNRGGEACHWFHLTINWKESTYFLKHKLLFYLFFFSSPETSKIPLPYLNKKCFIEYQAKYLVAVSGGHINTQITSLQGVREAAFFFIQISHLKWWTTGWTGLSFPSSQRCLNTQFVLHGSWQAAPLISAADAADAFLHSRLRWTFHRVQIPLKNPCAVKACAVSWAFRKGSVSNLSSLLWFFGEVQVKLLSPPDHFKEYFVVQIPFHSYLGQPDLEKTLWRDLMFRCREHDLPFLSSHLNTMYN